MKNLKLAIMILGFIAIQLIITKTVYAQPNWGGEIIWEAKMGSGYTFILKYYRNCQATNGPADSVYLQSNSPVPNILLHLMPGYPKDISPSCDSNSNLPHISCGISSTNPNGTVQEYIYTSDSAYPNGVILNGIPPANGWEFSFSPSGYRPVSQNLGVSTDLLIRSKMFPYNNNNAYPSFDGSPRFQVNPFIIITGGYDFTYNPSPFDPQMDSLVFSFGEIKNSNNTNSLFINGYSYNNPLPGLAQNVNNISATMNPQTGEISFKSYTAGIFYVNQKVVAFKCGVKVSETYRDLTFYILNPTSNTPPILTSSTGNMIDTFYFGQSFQIDFTLVDTQLQINGDSQFVNYEYFGKHFGSYIPGTSTTQPTNSINQGCISSLCTTLLPASTATALINQKTTFPFSLNQLVVCYPYHNGCGKLSSTFDYIFKISDNQCPVPAYTYKRYRVFIDSMPLINMPEISQISFDSNQIFLKWNPVIDSLNIFNHYEVHYFTSTGTDSIVDTTLNTFYNFPVTNLYNSSESFFIYPRGIGCNSYSLNQFKESTYSSVFLRDSLSASNLRLLTWNHFSNKLFPDTNQYFRIYRKVGQQTWTLIDSTKSLNYSDQTVYCDDTIYYKIGFQINTKLGISSYESFSNIIEKNIHDYTSPSIILMHSVLIDSLTGNASIKWYKSIDIDCYAYIVYKEKNSNWTPIDTVFNASDTIYIDYGSTLSTPSLPNDYRISAMDFCFNSSIMSSPVGLNKIDLKNSFNIFPNPAKNELNIEFESSSINGGLLKIFNQEGKIMDKFSIEDKSIKIDLTDYNTGIYLIEIQTKEGETYKKIFIKN
jgi:hypothetical protein